MIHTSLPDRRSDLASNGDEPLYEVIDGEWRELKPMGAQESALASTLCDFINQFARPRKLGRAYAEILFLIDRTRNLQRRPDAAYVSYPRWPARRPPRAGAWDTVPDIAIEVVSTTNTADDIDAKLTEYFAAGVRLVWVIYPESGRAYAYRSPTDVSGIAPNGELDGQDVLPGFRLKVADLFDDATRPE